MFWTADETLAVLFYGDAFAKIAKSAKRTGKLGGDQKASRRFFRDFIAIGAEGGV